MTRIVKGLPIENVLQDFLGHSVTDISHSTQDTLAGFHSTSQKAGVNSAKANALFVWSCFSYQAAKWECSCDATQSCSLIASSSD